MAEGFIVVEQPDDSAAPTAFWNGSILQEEMQNSLLFTSRQDARLVAGQLQASYPEREITILPARTTIQLVAPTLAVAPTLDRANRAT